MWYLECIHVHVCETLWKAIIGMSLWAKRDFIELFFGLFTVIIYVIPYIVTITANEDSYSAKSGLPSFFCLSRDVDFFFGYLLFPAVFVSSLGMFLLLFILFHIQLVRRLHTCNKEKTRL